MSYYLAGYALVKGEATDYQKRCAVGSYCKRLREQLEWTIEKASEKFEILPELYEAFEKGQVTIEGFTDEEILNYFKKHRDAKNNK